MAKFRKWAITVVAVVASLYHIYFTNFAIMHPLEYRAWHLAIMMVLGFLLFPIKEKKSKDFTVVDLVLSCMPLSVAAYISLNMERLTTRWALVSEVTPTDYVFGILAILLVWEMVRRIYGWALIVVSGVFIAYAYLGPYAPWIFRRPPLSTGKIVDHLFMGMDGIFGSPIGAASGLVALFLLFGAFLKVAGGTDWVVDIANALMGRGKGGPAKVAVVSSGLFGSLSGSAVANVMTTGSFTIPMMKRIGYRPAFAGAVEAVASTGGGLMPPVMGTAAFIMAEFTGIPYAQIALSAAVPAILYYFCALMMVHFEAERTGLRGLPEEEIPPVWGTLKRGLPFIIPLGLLIYLLARGWNATSAAFYATVAIIIVSWLGGNSRVGLAKMVSALEDGARALVPIAMGTACSGMIIGIVSLTGIGGKIMGLISVYGRDTLLLALVVAAVGALILGMGMPTSASYILTAAILAPSVTKLGIPVIAAHLFTLYYAQISHITPPVMLAGYAAAGLAQADPLQVGFNAIRLGIIGFVIPYLFVYDPGLVLIGSPGHIAEVVFTAVVGVVMLAGGFQGWLLRKAMLLERVGLVIAGLLMIIPGLTTDLIALVIGVIVVASQLMHARYLHARSTQGKA